MKIRWNSRLETVYKGSPGDRKKEDKLAPVEVTGDLVECPVCHAGVRSVLSPYTDSYNHIYFQITRVYGSHREGGRQPKYGLSCIGTGRKVQ